MSERITPLKGPYPPETQKIFDRIMPPGVEPLLLFRTLARGPRVYRKFNAGGLLDRGALTLRQREIAIDRTCALNKCEYEWGIHITFFAERAGLTPEMITALAAENPKVQGLWSEDERAIIDLCDELNATTRISDDLWVRLESGFSVDAILELIALAGFYRTVACFANGLQLPNESFGASFPVLKTWPPIRK